MRSNYKKPKRKSTDERRFIPLTGLKKTEIITARNSSSGFEYESSDNARFLRIDH